MDYQQLKLHVMSWWMQYNFGSYYCFWNLTKLQETRLETPKIFSPFSSVKLSFTKFAFLLSASKYTYLEIWQHSQESTWSYTGMLSTTQPFLYTSEQNTRQTDALNSPEHRNTDKLAWLVSLTQINKENKHKRKHMLFSSTVSWSGMKLLFHSPPT